MHVLLLSTEFPPFTVGGLGTHLRHLVSELSRHDIFFSILIGSQGTRDSIRECNREVIFLDPPELTPLQGFFDRFNRHSTAIEQKAISFFEARQTFPDLIHCHDWLSFPCAENLRNRWNVPIIASIHCIDYPMTWRWGESTPRHTADIEESMRVRADRLIAVSESVRDEVCRLTPSAAAKIIRIYNGLSQSSAIPEDAREFVRMTLDEENTSNKKIVLFAGRLVPQKGVRFLLDAARILSRRREDIAVIVAGDYNSEHGGHPPKPHPKR